ncbi:MAG: hypothetical protein ACTSW1_00580 [Candidatus Hodarchaeales archaeon]
MKRWIKAKGKVKEIFPKDVEGNFVIVNKDDFKKETHDVLSRFAQGLERSTEFSFVREGVCKPVEDEFTCQILTDMIFQNIPLKRSAHLDNIICQMKGINTINIKVPQVVRTGKKLVM